MFPAITLGAVAAASIALIMAWKRRQSDAFTAAGLAPSAPSKSGPGMVYDPRVQSGGRAHHIVDIGRFGRGIDMNRRTSAGALTPHWGMDITAPPLAPVRAALDGAVIESAPREGYGECVVVSHPQTGESTVYAHLSRRLVNVGDRVTGGQMVGLVGNTCSVPGRPVPSWCPRMGHHLHFEVHPAVRPTFSPTYRRTDPVRWLQGKGIEMVAWQVPAALLGSVQEFGDL